jgi:hypothetical protein
MRCFNLYQQTVISREEVICPLSLATSLIFSLSLLQGDGVGLGGGGEPAGGDGC